MRRQLAILFFGLAGAALAASAQAPPVRAWPNGNAPLDLGWRTHPGDNTAWAQPGFDDDGWTAVALTATSGEAGWRWYRLRTEIPAGAGPLALLICGGDGTYEVYVNGQRMPGPRLRSEMFLTYPRSRVVPLPGAGGSAVIALRTFIPPTSMFLEDRGSFRIAVGTLPDIENAHRAEQSTQFDTVVLGLAVDLLLLFGGIPLLILFWHQPDHREYLWLGCYLILCAFGNGTFECASITALAPFSTNWFISTPSNYLLTICQIEFTFCFVGRRVTRGWRIYEALLLVWPTFFVVPAWYGVLSRAAFDLVEVFFLVPASLVLPILLLLWYRRGNREAGWLILPSIFPLLTTSVADLGIVGPYFGWGRLAALANLLRIGRFAIEPFDLAGLLFLLAIGLVMFFRFTRVSRDQARGAAELEAAREIQQQLVPLALPAIPGCALAAAYIPANEVGGDFYQVLPQPSGHTLIVIGDVSGKGLKAAMTGALAIGALRAIAAQDPTPSTLLVRLNREILATQDGGFVTCLCARIAPDGAVALANAGHLSPYRNGQEISVDSGLPLGIAPKVEYSESQIRLAPGDRLTLLSDGVVESQSRTGELFGFDRAQLISSLSAEEIAHTAQRYGQQDDITVLTLTREAEEAAELPAGCRVD